MAQDTERDRAEQFTRALADLTENAPHANVVHSGGVVRWANRAALELLGIGDLSEAVGKALLDYVHPASRADVIERNLELQRGGRVNPYEAHLLGGDGREVVVESLATLTQWMGEPAVHVVLWDVGERRRRADRLAWKATHDSLTGLANRSAFSDQLMLALARLSHAPGLLAVFFLDLDEFKAINDTYGHLLGDKVLRSIGRRLGAAVRPTDVAARFGGDEFAVLVSWAPDTPFSRVEATAAHLATAVATPVSIGQASIQVTASVGWAATTDPSTDPEDLLHQADIASYRAKAAQTDGSRSGPRR